MNHTTGAQRHNKRMDKIWDAYNSQQKGKAEAILKTHYGTIENVIDSFGREYNAEPMFQPREVDKKDFMSETIDTDNMVIRVRSYSPQANTKNYLVAYQILTA